MLSSYAVVMPSMKIGGGNRVLLQFMDEAIKDKKNCNWYCAKKGDKK